MKNIRKVLRQSARDLFEKRFMKPERHHVDLRFPSVLEARDFIVDLVLKTRRFVLYRWHGLVVRLYRDDLPVESDDAFLRWTAGTVQKSYGFSSFEDWRPGNIRIAKMAGAFVEAYGDPMRVYDRLQRELSKSVLNIQYGKFA